MPSAQATAADCLVEADVRCLHPLQAVWSGQLSVLNQAQLSFDATVVGGAGDWAQLLPDSQVLDRTPVNHPFVMCTLCMCRLPPCPAS